MKEGLLKKIQELYQIPIYVYGKDGTLLRIPPELPKLPDLDGDRLKWMETIVEENQAPAFFLEDSVYYRGAMKDADGNLILLGPMSKKPVDKSAALVYRHSRNLEGELNLLHMDMKQARKILALLELELGGHDIAEERIRVATTVETVVNWNVDAEQEHYDLERSEWERDHNSVAYEEKLLEIVRTGNLEEAEKMIYSGDGLDEEHIGVVAGKADKQAEYLCIVLITILCRAAVQGGMNQEKAYSLADVYMRRVEKCKDIGEMYAIAARAQYQYTFEVREAKKEESEVSYIEQCKEYIARNLRKPLKVGDIAPAIGMNRSYLARRFSEVEGITIQNYITKERCIHAANMLKFSDYPISLIAEYFCFSSQSHFGKCFHQVYGMTPKTYRNKNRKNIEF